MAEVILIVDDEARLRRVVTGILHGAGFQVVEADSGPGALSVLADFPVDAVLIDQSMPGMAGLELTDRIRGLPDYGRVPVLFLSADDDPATRLAALRSGATDFMLKPFPMEEIVARLQAQLQLSARWGRRCGGLQARATTVADLATLGSDLNPAVLSRHICERISAAHGGDGVAVFSWLDHSGGPAMLAASDGGLERFGDVGATLVLRGQAGPWN